MSAIRLHRNIRRFVDPDKLLLKQYKLSKSERLDMLIRGLLLSQVAVFIGSSIYFIFLQTQLRWSYPKGKMKFFNLYWADLWDRLPIHVEHLFGAHWFGASQAAPAWWVTARHDFRHVLIGVLAALLIGAITVGLKRRKRASVTHMVLSVPAALVVAIIVATALILFFDWATPFMKHFGVSTGNPYVENLVGKGTIQLTLIGIVTGIFVKRFVLARTFDTVQLMSLERNIDQGSTEKWWWKYVYPPNYRKRFKYLIASGHQCLPHNRWLGITLSVCAPILLFWLGFGIWLLYFGPAAHAHG